MMNHDNDKKPAYWERMVKHRNLFAFTPIISSLLIIIFTLGLYYYFILTKNFFPEWQTYIYWSVKIIIGFEILAASARTFWGPILALIGGLAILFTIQVYDLNYLTTADGWQLIVAAAIGFIITIIVKL